MNRERHGTPTNPNGDPRAFCEGKKRFASFVDALRVLRRQRRFGNGDHGMVPYHCRACNGTHLGSPAPFARKASHSRYDPRIHDE